MNRKQEGLEESYITSFFFPEILERVPLIPRLFGRYRIMHLKNSLFDRRVSVQNLECDVFHGFEGCSLYSMRKAKQQGAITVLDYPIFHYKTIREVLIDEYKLLKLEIPDFLLKRDINILRKEQEISEADYIFVPTKRIADDFVRYGKEREKVKCISYGFNPNRFFVGQKKDAIFRILFVGIIGVRKGVHYLLEAVKQLNLKNIEVLLISPIEEEFKPVLSRYEGLFKHIHSLPNESLVRVYQNSSILVLPSLIEGSSLVIYEAMACGLPIIASENAGAITRNGIDGFVVPVRDIEALKEKILLLYENEELRRKMGESAAEYVKQFTWENYHKNIQCAYQEIFRNSHA
jgi:glycosyltransferase involved in cell wall biosynthesis